jgi:helicase MOV-10
VAFTRAMSMLVVLGHPDDLGKSFRWRLFIDYVHANGGCKGERIRWDAEEAPKAVLSRKGST